MCLAVTAVLDAVGSMWCCKFWSIRCASSQRHWVTQHSSPRPYQAAMTKMRQGERCLGGDRGLQMTNIRITASSVTAYLGLSLCLHAIFCLSVCLFACRLFALRLCASICLSICLSVSSLQSNALVTLNVISFLTTLSLLSLRFQQSINNYIVKSKQNIITAVTCWDSRRQYFNYLIALLV